MSNFLAELGGLTEGVGAEALAFAAGFAAARALEPAAVQISQEAFNAAPDKRLPPEIAAEAAAEDYASYNAMQAEAQYGGFDASRFAYLYDVTVTAPGMGELLNMLRRGTISTGNFEHGLAKAKLEPMWTPGLEDLQHQKISATDLAYMIVRGVVPDEGTLPGSLPTHADQLQLPPQLPINPVTEASATGWSEQQLAAMVARSGLAMAPVMAAQANFRGILTDNDYLLTIARGDLFPAYAGPVKEVSRVIPTTGNYVEHHLRGWSDALAMYDGTARHGMTKADTDVLYETTRRPLTVPTITKALARGGTFDTTNAPLADPYAASVHEANLGPEWYSLAEAMKYTYPSAFVLRQLLKDGAVTQTEASDIFKYEGYPPALADKIAAAYAPTTATAADAHVTKAMNALYTATHKSYIADEISDATATTSLQAAGVAAAAVPAVLQVWQAERDLIRKSLTAAQIKKAWSEGVDNPATGAPWTEAEATTRLLELGYGAEDAATFLSL